MKYNILPLLMMFVTMNQLVEAYLVKIKGLELTENVITTSKHYVFSDFNDPS